ncbi:MAG TPA: Lrp/AsnC family transcriptional regulator [Candidatus Eisenbacteria bacterium]|nr:Lrp/AsnC family transcriptional regulator [Candidatus Eisenbacteria bacterium]
MDTLDRKALHLLMRQGRATWAELGQLLGLSAPSAADRVRKLEEAQVITGYAALLDPTAVGYPLTAFIFITLANSRNRAAFLRAIAKMEQVSECHHIAGDDDYLLKVRCRTTANLDQLLAKELKDKLGVARSRTTIVLATAKESVQIPIAED